MTQIVFLTFGDQKFSESLRRIQVEASQLPFTKIVGVSDTELKSCTDFWDKHGEFVLANQRGFGYWIWKPFLILRELHAMSDGDVLVYADAGCTAHPNRDLFDASIEAVKSSDSGIMTYNSMSYERMFTKADLFDRMGARGLEMHFQRIATYFIIQRRASTVKLVERWYSIAGDYRNIDDSASDALNAVDFYEHRHDQSIFSILCNMDGSPMYSKSFIEGTRIRK